MYDLPLHFWYSTSSFGGASVTVPLTLAIALWLAVGYSWRIAGRWLVLIACAALVVTATKLAFLGWGIGVREWDFTGLSGHAMMSTAIYPVACFIALLPAKPAIRVAGIAAGFGMGIAISFSRVVVEAHSPSEAIAGCLMGALIALLFIRSAWHAERRRSQLSTVPVVVSLLVLMAALHNIHVPTHRWVEHIALKVSGHTRPFVRARWKAAYDDGSHAIRAPLSHTRNALAPLQPSAA